MESHIITGTTNVDICAKTVVVPSLKTGQPFEQKKADDAPHEHGFFSIQSPTISDTGTITLINDDGSTVSMTL